MSESIQTAVVTGAGRGFGRAISAALAATGSRVVGIARDAERLAAVQAELGANFTPIAADATAESLAHNTIREHAPRLLVLNAGVGALMRPIQEQTWDTFSRNWNTDAHHVFTWTRAALLAPLAPGSVVISLSSAAALLGSPLSGGYASAKQAIRYMRGYAAEESERGNLGIRFVTLLPQLTPATDMGEMAVAGYAARTGVDVPTFVKGLSPILTPEMVAKAVLDIAADPDSSAEYRVSGSGAEPLGLADPTN
ncbi:SDR family oxidoreductase [Nocardia inohanensis]|uniref:SDR family oxidoreductase n=1 Tax=Nocardia inohanensis TaxID=209246 RepID=UPI000830D091|nr:SDR family oxidoreductase [Nocardia inohanensis]